MLDGWSGRSRRHASPETVDWMTVPVGVGTEQ